MMFCEKNSFHNYVATLKSNAVEAAYFQGDTEDWNTQVVLSGATSQEVEDISSDVCAGAAQLSSDGEEDSTTSTD